MSDTTLKLLRRFSPKSDINYLDVICVPSELNFVFQAIQHDIPTSMKYAEEQTPDQGATGEEITIGVYEWGGLGPPESLWVSALWKFFHHYKDDVFEFRWETT